MCTPAWSCWWQETERCATLAAELERTKNRADLAFNEARDNVSQINTLQVTRVRACACMCVCVCPLYARVPWGPPCV